MDQASLPSTNPAKALGDALNEIAQRTAEAGRKVSEKHRKAFAQYFTPMPVAQQMADMLDVPAKAKVGDYGAGAGILGATVLGHSVADCSANEQCSDLHLQAYEVDDLLHQAFHMNVARIADLARELWQPAPTTSLKGDFVPEAPNILGKDFEPFLDVAILNPPYKKLHQQSPLAKLLRDKAAPAPNLYAAFILLAVRCLKKDGQLVAIVPRSFCNGDYFRQFRAWLKSEGSIDWLVRYKRRSNVFRADNVLQENVIFRFRKGAEQKATVRVSLSTDPETPPETDTIVPREYVLPVDDDRIYVPSSESEIAAIQANRQLPCSFEDLGLVIGTGKFEEFRVRDSLTDHPPTNGDWAPMVYAHHWERGSRKVKWTPAVNGKAACVSLPCSRLSQRLVDAGYYVILKRISANDDRTGRVHPAVVTPECLPGDRWAFENHIQVIGPARGKTMTKTMAEGLAGFLASSDVDQVLKSISGTTQINCNDIRRLRYPGRHELNACTL